MTVLMIKDNKITRWYNYEDTDLHNKNNNIKVEGKEHKIVNDNAHYGIGIDIRTLDDKGFKLPLQTLVDNKLLILDKNKKIEDNEIVDMTEIEQYRAYKEIDVEAWQNKAIDTHEDIEYLREKTMLEKYDDKLVSKEDYNIYIVECRKQARTQDMDCLTMEWTRTNDPMIKESIDKLEIEIRAKYVKKD